MWWDKYKSLLCSGCDHIVERLEQYKSPQEAWEHWRNLDDMIRLLQRLEVPEKEMRAWYADIMENYFPLFFPDLETISTWSSKNHAFHVSVFKELAEDDNFPAAKGKQIMNKMVQEYTINIADKVPYEKRGVESDYYASVYDLYSFAFETRFTFPSLAVGCEGAKWSRTRKKAQQWLLASLRKHFPNPLIYWKG
jgi:hypothetical protein